jgi:hypothetical protein
MLACAFFWRSIFCFAYQQFVHEDNFLATLEALSNSSSSENDGHVRFYVPLLNKKENSILILFQV